MASLVADYESDENELTDSDSDTASQAMLKDRKETQIIQNFFASSQSDESDEDSEDLEKSSENSRITENRLPNPLSQKLPIPSLDCVETDNAVSSVFANPFELAEQARNSVLEKHVKMVEKKIPKGKEGQICWKFKRGKCRFGKNCKYSHDLGSEVSVIQRSLCVDEDKGHNDVNNVTQQGLQSYHCSSVCQTDTTDEDSYMAQAKRKKRGGVSDRLVPPKKALMSLQKQRQTERPWTVNKKS